MFTLHSQLEKDTTVVGSLPLSLLLLANDANYPWCILVPKKSDIREIHELSVVDRVQLLEESCVLSQVMEVLFDPVKMNVAALGNMVPQLHLHHVARYESDQAWPKPIWGVAEAVNYDKESLGKRVVMLQKAFENTDLRLET